jgi:hypothetical protein
MPTLASTAQATGIVIIAPDLLEGGRRCLASWGAA